eukprot:TRINITY_DN6864_c0_g1_i3.p1 TRINITY_DN6864_c0_g1~~TRINITY_DN6864_c0_g1_i3.p1  ORF type:complete len:984 (+),score=206.90 TRINITY_DN6864_c0_g1_i3:44-2995(+)
MSLLLSLEVDEDIQRALTRVEEGCKSRPEPGCLATSGGDAHGKEKVLGASTKEKRVDSPVGVEQPQHPLLSAVTADDYYRELAQPEMAVTPCDESTSYNQPEVTDTGVAGHKERVRRWLGKVQYWMLQSDSLTGEINTLNKKLLSLMQINEAVKQQSTFLSSNASALITNAENCQQLCQGIEYRLQHFATVDRLSNAFSSPVLDPRSSTFRELLTDMDTTLAFLSNNRQFKSATQYLSRMHVTYQKALVLLRDACMTSISEVTASVKEDPRFKAVRGRTTSKRGWFGTEQPNSGQLDTSTISVDEKPAGMDSTLEELSVSGGVTPGLFGLGSILSVEFRGKLHDTIPLINSLRSRTTTETAVFLQDVVDSYILARLSILTPIFTDYMTPHLNTTEKNLEDMIAHGTTYLLALAADEADLFRHIWQDDSKLAAAKSIIDSVSLVLYDGFRGSVIVEDDLQVLCNVIHSLNNSILSKLQASGEAGQLLASTLSHMCQDAQERLIFRVSMYIKDVIRPFNFTQQQCLQYTHQPNVTTRKGSDSAATHQAKEAADVAQENNASTIAREGGPGDEAPVGLRKRQLAYFPALQNTLNLLSWVYKVVDKGVFTTLAQEAIRACTSALEQVAATIEGVPRAMLRTPLLDAKLFLVMHLLQLREQISPFDVDFQVTEKHVDFTNIRFHEISLASTLVDTKKNLEQQLRDVCKDFIKVAGHYVTSPADSFGKILKERVSDPLDTPVSQVMDTIGAVVGGIKAQVDAQRNADKQKSAATVNKPDAVPAPTPEGVPAPAPVPVPTPEGAPVTAPAPEGVPVPSPAAPVPTPEGVPAPAPVPVPTPEGGAPAPVPVPAPTQPNGNGASNNAQQSPQQLSKLYNRGIEKLTQVLTAYRAVMQGLEEALPMLQAKMRFYLANNYTMDLLFKPVAETVKLVYSDMYSVLVTFVQSIVQKGGLEKKQETQFFEQVRRPENIIQWMEALASSKTEPVSLAE